jgi:ribosome-associated protein
MRRRELPGGIAPPTKSELKRQAQAVQDLAKRLIDAPQGVAEGLDLPEKLTDAIALARRITSHAARVRQRQFVAKLMRDIDPAPLTAALDAHSAAARLEAARFKRAERWRDRLVGGDAAVLAEFLAAHPSANGAELATLVAAAIAERQGGRAAGTGRRLFRLVQDMLLAEP